VTYSLYGDSVYVVKPAPAKEGQGQAQAQGGGAQAQEAQQKAAEPALIADRRFVKTGAVREDRVAILSGLQAGEQVVTTGQIKLNPGASIRIDNTQPLNRSGERPKQ